MESVSKTYLTAMGLGAIAGMRSMAAPALLSQQLSRMDDSVLQDSPFRYLQSGPVATTLSVLALGELIADKVPNVPDRIDGPSFFFRTLSGAVVGAAAATAAKEDATKGAILGGLAAAAATFGFYYLRKSLGSNSNMANAAWGFVEDAIAVSSGIGLTR
jgi:uncharacterized membrane protein